jgi:hypothetical protein
MKTTLRTFTLAALLLTVFAGLASGQTALSSTTLSADVLAGDLQITVASASGMTAYGPTGYNTMLYIDKEAMELVSIAGTQLTVRRSRAGSKLSAHNSAAVVWFGTPAQFAAADPAGACAVTASLIQPRIVPRTGNAWYCMDSLWVQVDVTETTYTKKNVGAAEALVTAAEYGNGRSHITKLTFTSLAIGSGATADLGFGAKLYTFPAGALLVKGAYMSVALAGAGSGCDADTPDGGLGTVVASGVVKVLGGTGTFEDILTGQTFNDVNGTAEVKTVSAALVREAADAHTVFLNLADDWAGACAVTATGTVVLEWVLLN